MHRDHGASGHCIYVETMINAHGDLKYEAGTRLCSSEAKGWENILAERRQHKAGLLQEVEPKSTEIAILLEGKLRVRRRGDGRVQDAIAVPGTVWICPAGIEDHDVQLFGDMEDCLHIYLPAEPISNSVLQEFDLDPAHIQLGYESGFQDPMIEQIARVFMSEMEQESAVSRLLVDSMQTALSVHLVKHYSNAPARRTILTKTNGTLDKKRSHRVEEYIVNHLDHNISLKDLANEACLSPFHFARSFKLTMGVSPHQYVLSRKLELAKSLIRKETFTFMQISLMTGFSNQAHFTRAFKRATGHTPGQYRSSLRG